MLEDNSDEEIRLIRKYEREQDILNSLNISDSKDVNGECNQSTLFTHSAPVRHKKSLQFPVVKKWKSPRRNSIRNRKFEDSDFLYDYDSFFEEYGDEYNANENKSLSYGSIRGVEVGDWWHSRIECSSIGVHNPTVEGVHAGKQGAYSVSVSGFFEDDQDHGYFFIYTDSVGREFQGTKSNRKNLRIAPQIKNQVADGPNKSLMKSVQTRNPIRVIRGFRLNSPFAPKTGYRYDGLYTAEKYWRSRHVSGFLIYKFLMKRCDNQPPPPWCTNRANLQNQMSPIRNSKSLPDYGNTTQISRGFVNSHRCSGSVKANSKSVDRSTSVKIISCKTKTLQCQHSKTTVSTSGSQNVSVRNEENKENTINIQAKWIQKGSLVDSRCDITVSTNIALPNLRNDILCRLPPCKRTSANLNDDESNDVVVQARKMWLKRMFPKLYTKTRRKKNILSHRSKYSVRRIKECEKFRGFSGERCSGKMILLGFLIHKLESKIRGQ